MTIFKKIGWLVTIFSSFGCCASTELHQAARAGDIELVQALILSGANVNLQSFLGLTPLHEAAFGRRLEVVQALIAAGANVDAQKIGGATALHEAAVHGSLEIVKVLIAAGANIHVLNASGKTPEQQAARWGRTAIVDYINAYKQRVQEAHKRAPMIRRTLAMATHARLGAESPLRILPQHLLHDIAYLATAAEFHDAAQPK